MKLLKTGSLFVLLSLSLALAQTFTGNYLLQDDVVKLTLEQNGTRVIGQLTGNGLSFDLEGELNPDNSTTAYGYLFTDDNKYLFAIVLEEPVLNMILFSILDNGEPDPDDTETFVFNRIDYLGPNVGNSNKQTQATNPSAAATETSPVTNTAQTTAPNRLPTINSPTNTTATATNTQTQTDVTQNPVGSNPLAPTPANSTGTAMQNPLVRADPFIGVFEGDGLKLVLNKNGASYSGSLDFRGNSYPLTAVKKANGLVGSFKSGDKYFSFSAAIDSTKLTLVSDGAIYTLEKQ